MAELRGGLVSSIAATAIGPHVPTHPPVSPELDPGTLVDGRYRIEAVLGRGGMGVVYRAEQLTMQRPVALKMLRDVLAGSEMMTVRFRREALAASRVRSPHVVTLHDFGVTGDGAHLYLVMELLEGEALSDRLQREGRLPPEVAVSMARQIATALAAAHEAGVVHRDLKPENVLIQPDGHLKVVDFGIARIYEHDGASSLSVTDTNTIVGTPLYMSPETVARRPIGPSSDLYSLGVMLFEMLTGRAPFEENEAVLLMSAHLITPAPRLGDVAPELALPRELDALVSRLLAKTPDARPASAREVIAELDAITWETPTSFADRTGPIQLPSSSARTPTAPARPAPAAPTPREEHTPSSEPEREPTAPRGDALASTALVEVAPTAPADERPGTDDPATDASVTTTREPARAAPSRAVTLGVAALLAVALTTGGAAWWVWPSAHSPVGEPTAPRERAIDSAPASEPSVGAPSEPTVGASPSELTVGVSPSEPRVEAPVDRADRAPTTEVAAARSVRITFDVEPADATLLLDGRPLASRTIDLSADDATVHELVATAPGRRRAEITFVADETRTIEVRLAPERRRPRTDPPPSGSPPPAGEPAWNQLRGW